MREIKFRAWDKFNRVMVPVDMIDYSLGFNNRPAVFLCNDNYAGWIRHHDDYELMQFIGVRDINGKDIYEGDILKSGAGIGVVKFYNGAFRYDISIKQNEFTGCLYFDTVIGNIHENPELLNGGDDENN